MPRLAADRGVEPKEIQRAQIAVASVLLLTLLIAREEADRARIWAELGSAESQHDLGTIYASEESESHDYREAVK